MKRYINGESINQIRKETGIHHKTFCKILEEFGVEKRTRSTSHSNKIVNDCDIFEKIDTREKAYWLGVLASDGYVGDNTYTIKLSMCDGDVVYNFADFLKVDKTNVKVTTFPKDTNRRTVYTLGFQDKKMNFDLRNNGVFANKSLVLKPPLHISKEFYWDYIRGYFDGDGGLSVTGNRIQLYFTGTFELCKWLLEIFNKSYLKQPFPENKSNGNNTYRISINGKNEVFNIASKIYKNSQHNTRMKRKYDIFKTYYTDHPVE